MPAHDTEAVRAWLNWLNGTVGVPWARISKEVGIPAGTLWAIANGSGIPRKWRRPVFRDLLAMPVKELRWAIRKRR